MTNILIVDDERQVIEQVRSLLTDFGYSSKFLVNSDFLFQLLEKEPIDLILMDITMPGIDGITLLKQIKAYPAYHAIPVIMLTGETDEQVLADCFEFGATDYITKPVGKLILQARVKTALAAKQTKDELKQRVRERTVELEASESKNKAILDAIPDIMFRLSREGVLLDFKTNISDALTLFSQERIGTKIKDSLPNDFVEKCMSYVNQALVSGSMQMFEYQFPGQKGIQDLEARLVVSGAGEVLAIVRNITERKQAEKERQQLEDQLRQAQKMEAVGELAGGIAHEFNNLLVPIVLGTTMVQEKLDSNGKEYKHLDLVLKSADRAKELISKILVFGRKTDLNRKPVHLELIIEDALTLLRPTLPKIVSIQEEIDFTLPPVLVDFSQIHQVIVNLCVNANHAMFNGGELKIKLENAGYRQFLSSQGEEIKGDFICLSIQDTGCGMDTPTMKRIFEPFFTTKGIGQGTGLGLALVLGIVEQHGGHIEVNSEVEKGSRFDVYLPMTENMDAEILSEAMRPASPIRGNEHILFVDDDELVNKMGALALEKLGYQVTNLMDSQEALELFHTHPEKFDLVITDYTMPKITGEKLARQLKEIRPDIPIILSTGHQENISHDITKSQVINAFLAKPYQLEKLGQVLRQMLDKAKTE